MINYIVYIIILIILIIVSVIVIKEIKRGIEEKQYLNKNYDYDKYKNIKNSNEKY